MENYCKETKETILYDFGLRREKQKERKLNGNLSSQE
jgi:hypothetical protein